MFSEAFRCFRNLAVTESSDDVETDADSIFSAANSLSSVSSTESTYSARSVSRYRQRYGRGGRVYVDRTFTSDEKDDLEKTELKLLLQNPIPEERLRFDSRTCEDEKPISLNEFSIEYVCLINIISQPVKYPIGQGLSLLHLLAIFQLPVFELLQAICLVRLWHVLKSTAPPHQDNLSSIKRRNSLLSSIFGVCTNLRISRLISLSFI